ncbi:MAG: hypothetical protein HFI05_01960 [Lachnospiraceae bacterium]|jgi:hypothetical protein|nr:hypothetical protein [Lachnospiraceae bacterium]
MQKEIIGRLPTIPEYYRDWINKNVDLEYNPKQCCPFHKEDTPSFSYSAEKGKWRCFGSCKCGGDIIDLHKKNYHLRSRTEAECSLKNLYHIVDKIELKRENVNLFVDDDKITQEVIYQKALLLANNVEKWLELDYFMSKTPIDITELESIVKRWESEEHEKVIYKKYSIFRKNKG